MFRFRFVGGRCSVRRCCRSVSCFPGSFILSLCCSISFVLRFPLFSSVGCFPSSLACSRFPFRGHVFPWRCGGRKKNARCSLGLLSGYGGHGCEVEGFWSWKGRAKRFQKRGAWDGWHISGGGVSSRRVRSPAGCWSLTSCLGQWEAFERGRSLRHVRG